jgi:hypothetical protein
LFVCDTFNAASSNAGRAALQCPHHGATKPTIAFGDAFTITSNVSGVNDFTGAAHDSASFSFGGV